MQLTETALSGIYLIDIDLKIDERGGFARTWDPVIAHQHDLIERFDYTCISTNTNRHTLRGMHYQKDPHGETKLVRCTKGSVFDVVIDLRASSPTYLESINAELTEANHRAVYVPAGCAHGFLTLTDDTEILYHIAGTFVPEAAAGICFDDPAVQIAWPAKPAVIAPRDAAYPYLQV